jgi:mono/diheme cytochrome c family protein
MKANKITVCIIGALVMAAVSTGCYNSRTGEVNFGGAIHFELPAFPQTGSHAVQVFSEMHFSPAYRSQEVPRLLPPDGSVPVTGAEIKRLDVEQFKELSLTQDALSAYDDERANRLYQVNCQVCHGRNLDGAGPITTLKSSRNDGSNALNKGSMPVNLNSERVRTLSDGEIFGYITWGGRAGLSAASRDKRSSASMPQFGKLLSEDERWELVWFLRQRIGSK